MRSCLGIGRHPTIKVTVATDLRGGGVDRYDSLVGVAYGARECRPCLAAPDVAVERPAVGQTRGAAIQPKGRVETATSHPGGETHVVHPVTWQPQCVLML